jgi:hypothetical protein
MERCSYFFSSPVLLRARWRSALSCRVTEGAQSRANCDPFAQLNSLVVAITAPSAQALSLAHTMGAATNS